MDWLEDVEILMWLVIELMEWLWFRHGCNLWDELLVTESNLFDETIGGSFLYGFASGFRLLIFILVGMVFL